MTNLNHINEKLLSKTKGRLWMVSGSLRGLEGLMTQSMREVCMEPDQLFGVGQLLELLSEELIIINDVLGCGKDSMVENRYGYDSDEEDTD